MFYGLRWAAGLVSLIGEPLAGLAESGVVVESVPAGEQVGVSLQLDVEAAERAFAVDGVGESPDRVVVIDRGDEPLHGAVGSLRALTNDEQPPGRVVELDLEQARVTAGFDGNLGPDLAVVEIHEPFGAGVFGERVGEVFEIHAERGELRRRSCGVVFEGAREDVVAVPAAGRNASINSSEILPRAASVSST